MEENEPIDYKHLEMNHVIFIQILYYCYYFKFISTD